MIVELDVSAPGVAERVVEIQREAYAVEADLIGFDGIPQLHETSHDVAARSDLTWLGAFDGSALVGVIAWTESTELVDIDRLAVAPSHSRRGYGRRLVEAIPPAARTTVSTGAANLPARALYEHLGFRFCAEAEIAPSVFVARYEKADSGTA